MQSIQATIDAVLVKVKEPQSLLSVADLNLVERVHYSESEKKLICYLGIGTPRFQCPACSAINGVVKEGIARQLNEEFTAALPGWEIEIK